MDIAQSSNRIVNNFPPLNNMTPFTRVDGWSFLEVLEGLRYHIVNVMTPELDKMIAGWKEAYEKLLKDIEDKYDEWDDRFDAFMADVVAQLEALNDQAVANLIRNSLSQTAIALQEKFVEHHSKEFFIDIAEYGAKQDGSDSADAIEAANAIAASQGKTLVASGTYSIKRPITITADCDFTAALFNIDTEGRAITVTSVRRRHMFGDIVNTRKLPGGWSSVTNSVGLTVRNCNTSTIGYQFIRNFEHGLSVFGDKGGSAYNTFHCGALWHNKVNLVLETVSDPGTGYSNQNTFIGGRFAHETADVSANTPGVYHVWFRGGVSTDDGGRSNNNQFLNCSFEGVMPEITVYFENASTNQLLNCRYEFGNKVVFGANSRDNQLIGGFGLAEITKEVLPGALRNEWESATEKVHYSKFIRHRNANQDFPWFEMNWSNRSLALGVGSAEPRKIRASSSAALSVDASWMPDIDATYDQGSPTRQWRNFFAQNTQTKNVTFGDLGYPTAPTEGGRLYVTKNASNKYVLGVRWPNGDSNTIATQA